MCLCFRNPRTIANGPGAPDLFIVRSWKTFLTCRRYRYTPAVPLSWRSEEHTSELQSLMRISYAVFCLKKKTQNRNITIITNRLQTTIITSRQLKRVIIQQKYDSTT